MRKLISLVLLSVLSFSLVVTPAFAKSVAEIRLEAKSAFRSGDYEKATSLYQKLVKMQPDRLNVLKEAMWIYWNMGKIPEAREMADAVKGISPEDTEAQKILGWAPAAMNRNQITDLHTKAKAAYQRGDFDEAASLFSQITALDPKNVQMLRDRMWILWNMKRVGEATDIAQKILKLRPNDADAQSILDRAPNVATRINKAAPASPEMIEELRKKVTEDPDNATATRQLAWSLFNVGRGAEAEARLKTYLATNPDNAEMWMQLGKIQQIRGGDDSANESYVKSLQIDSNQPQLLSAMGRKYFGTRDLDESVRYFERAVSLGSAESRELTPILAKSLFYRGEYRRSSEMWSKAVDAFPDRSDYRFHEAEAIFYAGDEGLALAKMRQLKYEFKEPKAVAFLVDNAVARGDYNAAAILLAEDLDKLSIEKGRRVIRLANIYVKLNRFNNAIALLKRWVNFSARDVWALLTLASIQRDANLFEDSISTYERILRLNPRCLEALQGMSQAYMGMGDNEQAIVYYEKALAQEPTNPHMIREYASLLFTSGQRRRGRQIMSEWIKENGKSTVLPMLLYHGLTPFDDSPMLGYEIHTTVSAFESQMRSLREAGYEPINIQGIDDWYNRRDTVPEKPIFICFDDARMDSFKYADPVLDQYGLFATMFVPLDDVESYGSIGYANWNKMRDYQKTGRWYFQSHGGRAHSKIPVDSRGRQMLYLVMPQWLPSKGRVETEDEWKERIENDHKLIKVKLQQNLNTAPIGYAWPEGAYGEHSDSRTAIENNLTALRKHFTYGFVQDLYGLNMPSQDPLFLHRIEPSKNWSGKDLVNHMANKNPLSMAYKQMIEMALSEKKFSEANQWLDKLKAMGVSESTYLAQKARINYASGRSSQAYQLAMQSFTSEPTAEVQKMLTEFQSRSGIIWRPNLSFQHDNETRESLAFEQDFDFPLAIQLKAIGRYARTKFSEDNFDDIYETKLGGGIEFGWGNGQTIRALAIQHNVSGPTDDLLGYSANYWGRFTDTFRVRLEGRRSFHGSVQAIAADVKENMYRGSAHWGEKDDWGLGLQAGMSDLSDNNKRKGTEFVAGWPFFEKLLPGSGPVYRFVYDDMRRLDEKYYSPQDLRIHELGAQYVYAPKPAFKFNLRYLPGYSSEHGRDTRFSQNVEVSALWAINPNVSLTPTFFYEETGAYYYNMSSVEMEWRF